jgi:hypothetical protein
VLPVIGYDEYAQRLADTGMPERGELLRELHRRQLVSRGSFAVSSLGIADARYAAAPPAKVQLSLKAEQRGVFDPAYGWGHEQPLARRPCCMRIATACAAAGLESRGLWRCRGSSGGWLRHAIP